MCHVHARPVLSALPMQILSFRYGRWFVLIWKLTMYDFPTPYEITMGDKNPKKAPKKKKDRSVKVPTEDGFRCMW
eukprot:g34664.t1